MRKHGNRKFLALIMTLCMVFQMTGGASFAEASTVEPKITTSEEAAISLLSVTGSAITYYVGGTSGSNNNTGKDSTAPFATLSKAAQEINQSTPGAYEVIVLGDTYETERMLIGDGVSDFNVTIHAVSGSAIIMRDLTCTGDMITVTNHASLSLGNETGSLADLTLHGGRGYNGSYVKDGRIIKVDIGGSLSLYPDITLCENYHEINPNNYRIGDGGAIYNSGTLLMYGGTIRDNYAHNGTGVYNAGIFKLYGGTIRDNHRASYGSGVYNAELATFEMYGGLIANNDADSYAGGVGNFGLFKLFGGTIDGNYANSNGGVYNGNDATMEMSGGTISNNKADYHAGGIMNSGYLIMSGGTICNNISDAVSTPYDAMYDEKGGGIANYETFVMTGGTIEGNDSEFGGAVYVYANATFSMSGGTIQNNSAIEGGAIYCDGLLTISGNVEIPGGIDSSNNVYANKPVTIGGTITSSSVISLVLGNFSNNIGNRWLMENAAGLTADNYEKFLLTNSAYQFSNQGIIEYIGQATTYYVGGPNANDSNNGTSPDLPFATLQHALEVGNDNTSTFILQSDQVLHNTIFVKGNITIKSSIAESTITRSGSFNRQYLFYLENSTLSLGSSEDENDTNKLIIDGENVYASSLRTFFIRSGSMNLFEGVIIKGNNLSDSCIHNNGTLNMYGGSIEGNTTSDGIIKNYGSFNMSGGRIHDNTGFGVYNAADEDMDDETVIGSFFMSGGSIYNNTTGRGILNEGNLVLSESASFPVVDNQQDEIYLAGNETLITVGGNLSTAEPILISRTSYIEGDQILQGEETLLGNNHNKFRLMNSDYSIDENGIIRYDLPSVVFYVNAAGNDGNDGSIAAPYATLKKAVAEINGGIGTIILQSDITVTEPVVIIEGTISLLSDGNPNTIYRGEKFKAYTDDNVYNSTSMFLVYGKLNLGSNIGGNDEAPSLILDGGGENGIQATDPIISNYGSLSMYSGVSLQHNYTGQHESPSVISEGKFIMYGGLIQNNSAEYESGVLIYSGTFVMNGGTIRDNIGDWAGVILYYSQFTMNGGTISGNSGDVSYEGSAGVIAYSSNVTITDGSISSNIGGFAGVMIGERSNLKISGGLIEDNSGLRAGIAVIYESDIELSGGTIGGNIGSGGLLIGTPIGDNAGSNGIAGVILMEADLIISGNPVLESDNEIIFFEESQQQSIKIEAPLTGTAPTMSIRFFRFDDELEEFLQEYVIGRQLLVSGEDYTFTQEDVSRFKLSNPEYGINPSGKIGIDIKSSWITISPDRVHYDGKEKKVTFVIENGSTKLTEGTDYTVSFGNNYAAGTASFTVTGIGIYAGIVNMNYTIDKAYVMNIQTPPPANKTFLATDQKTEVDLLQSIGLSSVLVQTNMGYYSLPIVWNLTGGTFNPDGGTYTYTGTVQSSTNIDANGLTMTTQIVVKPEEPFLQTNGSFKVGPSNVPYMISYYKAGDSMNAEYDFSEELAQGTVERLIIPISSRQLINQLTVEDVTRLSITVPLSGSMLDSAHLGRLGIRLSKDILKKAKELGKDVTVIIADENGKEIYSWTFTGDNLKNSNEEITDVDLFLDVSEIDGNDELPTQLGKTSEDMGNVHGLVIDFGQEGTLPSQAGIRIYVGDREGITPGSRIYLYHYNPDTGKLETLPFSSGYLVDEEGYISIELLHCSDYLMLLEEAASSSITPLRDQITVEVENKVIEIGKSTSILINLPKTLELLDSSEDKTTQSAVGGVTATYRSSKEKVATIDRSGKITAKEAGTVTIYTTVTLYSGKTKIFKTTISVRK